MTKLSGEQYGTSENLKAIEANGDMSNGTPQYDLSKSDINLVKKEEKYQPGNTANVAIFNQPFIYHS